MNTVRARRILEVSVLLSLGVTIFLLLCCSAREEARTPNPPQMVYPLDETIFPPEIAAPTFRWTTGAGPVASWSITVGDRDERSKVTARTTELEWTPSPEQWRAIRKLSRGKATKVTVRGVAKNGDQSSQSETSIVITTSQDEVGASLFYREVNLPFIDAVKDPTHIRWRFGSIASEEPPPIVLEKLPVCGNCHSFSSDGSVFGMDVDYANDKGSYVVTEVVEEILLERENIITWSDFARDDGELTFGLLSQVSPDGDYVVSTVKDRSVFVPMPDLDFSQLFFPVKGILVVYNRHARTFESLRGADDRSYVQSNPTWSPDGEQIVFAKTKAHQLTNVGNQVLLSREDAREFIEGGRSFLFDLYRVPFNGGEGGEAVPLDGASNNGMSNFFPRYSPDGRWIVFTKARSFMLLQPDAELYIMPAAGGEPRRMRCNTPRMNSWHSWSPNGRWLVFSSKPDGPYTQLYLTHIDEEGNSSPPVHLDRMVSPRRAANIPEFVDLRPDAIKRIRERFVDAESFFRAGNDAMQVRAIEDAERAFRKALSLSPDHLDALNNLGMLLMRSDRNDEARGYLKRAVKLRPDFVAANNNLAVNLLKARDYELTRSYLTKYLEHRPDDVSALSNLGVAEEQLGELGRARTCYEKALRHRPEHTQSRCNLGKLLMRTGEIEQARLHLARCDAAAPGQPR